MIRPARSIKCERKNEDKRAKSCDGERRRIRSFETTTRTKFTIKLLNDNQSKEVQKHLQEHHLHPQEHGTTQVVDLHNAELSGDYLVLV